KPVTNKEWGEIERMQEGIVTVGDDVGVDVRDRLPKREHYHLFDDKQAYRASLESFAIHPEDLSDISRGMYLPSTGIFLIRHDDLTQASLAGHETAHSISAVIKPPDFEKITNPNKLDHPYRPPEGGILMNEAVTNMTANLAMYHGDFPGCRMGYGNANYMLTAMVREAADAQRIDPQEIEDMLIRGLFTNDQAGIDLLKEALGHERVERFMKLESDSDSNRAKRDAEALGLPWAASAIRDAQKGHGPNSFNW
ncbi:MAG TPA: hypothetical protein VHT70_02090, partial [Candidatus Saccharimonadales bacterium]|nr:hypothetical protein [Candidatus Saccharimonadales bacterium]